MAVCKGAIARGKAFRRVRRKHERINDVRCRRSAGSVGGTAGDAKLLLPLTRLSGTSAPTPMLHSSTQFGGGLRCFSRWAGVWSRGQETQDTHKGDLSSSRTPATGKAPPIPDLIGRYRVVDVLGEGGFGRVYRAHDEALGRFVAIKVPLATHGRSDTDLQEAQVLASLNHPYIVPVHDVGQLPDGRVYVVSQFMSGGDLATKIRESRPSHIDTARMIAKIAHALHHAHLQGLFHRDIKPGNILFDAKGNPYLADFGLALHDGELGTGSGVAGTIAYIEPGAGPRRSKPG